MSTASNVITIDCSDKGFTDQILKLSEDNKNPLAPRILKLYSGAEELERTEAVLRCRGRAALSQGGESSITYHYEVDRDGDTFIGYEIGDAISTPTPATTLQGYSLDNPVAAGEVLSASDGTELQVLGIVENARQQIARENQFNDPPESGKRFYMVSVEVAYPAGNDSRRVSESDFILIGSSRVVYDQFEHTCGVVPDELDGEIYGGGRIQGNICFEVPEDESGLVLGHQPDYGIESRRFLSLTHCEIGYDHTVVEVVVL